MLATMYGVPDGLRYCPDCRRATPVVLDNASGAAVCTQCTFVLRERPVDEFPDWRTFADDGTTGAGRDRSSRVGGAADPFLPVDGHLATTIAYSAPLKLNASADGGAVIATKTRAAVVPKMRGAIVGSVANEGFKAIADIADRLGVTATVRDRAKEVLKKMEEAKVCPKGRNRVEAYYLACIHAACRAEGAPRTLKELFTAASDGAAARKDIGKFIHLIKKHAGIDEDGGGQEADSRGAVVRAGDYLRRFGSVLGMGDQEVSEAEGAARRLEESLDVRRNPQSIAAAVIYMAIQRAGIAKSARDVSVATGVGEATIKEAYRELCPHAEMLFGAQ